MSSHAHNSSFRFFSSLGKNEVQISRVLTNQTVGPLISRASAPCTTDLQRRLTGEMRCFHSDTDFRSTPDINTTEVSLPGQHVVHESKFVDCGPTLREHACVTTQCHNKNDTISLIAASPNNTKPKSGDHQISEFDNDISVEIMNIHKYCF